MTDEKHELIDNLNKLIEKKNKLKKEVDTFFRERIGGVPRKGTTFQGRRYETQDGTIRYTVRSHVYSKESQETKTYSHGRIDKLGISKEELFNMLNKQTQVKELESQIRRCKNAIGILKGKKRGRKRVLGMS